ncbi:MAG: M1 family metallopeptidase [Clostridia bacterium]|nr:M1 family metallopeptidase [Clostridia bacterium]
MKKFVKFGVVFGVLLLMLIGGVSLTACAGKVDEKRNHYTLNVVYDEVNMTLLGEERVIYVNTSENAFDKLYFHLYPNAFREGAKASVVSGSKKDEAYYNGLSYGCIEIRAVSIEGYDVCYEIEGEDKNILAITLQEALYPDEFITINISFSAEMPQIHHRFGVGENTINVGNFYPIACVYEDGVGFSKDLYHANGDPFYSECADYIVTIDCSDAFQVASTGMVKGSHIKNGRLITTVFAENVRDFCFVLSEKFEVATQTFEGVAVNYYGYKGDKDIEKNLQVAIKALKTFNQLFGVYPYTTLSVVKANFIHGGMEYPNIVLISDKVSEQDFEYVIVHEIAHQWWYGVVGNNQYIHAWMDEGLAEYSALLFYKINTEYGEDFDKMIDSARKSYRLYVKVFTKVNGGADGVMDKPICEYATEPEYVECTYTKGVLLMDAIKNSIGEKNFLKALKLYYNQFKFKLAAPEDFIASFIKVSSGDMEGFINSWLYDKVVV